MSRRAALLMAAAVASVVLPRPLTAAATDDVTLPGCTSKCGNISIPYPFGVEQGCGLQKCIADMSSGRRVYRNDSSVGHHGSPKLFLGDGTVEVLEISIPDATVRINASFAYFPGTENALGPNPITSDTWSGAIKQDELYSLALGRNRMVVEGCNVQAFLMDKSNISVSTCSTLCDWDEQAQTWTYQGPDFCEATILRASFFYDFKVLWMNMTGGAARHRDSVTVSILDVDLVQNLTYEDSWKRLRPAVLDWRVNHTTCQPNGHDGWFSARSAACRSRHSYCLPAGAHPRLLQDHICKCHKGPF